MEITILSAGDAEYLYMVLNAISMLSGSERGTEVLPGIYMTRYSLLATIAALLSLMIIAARAMLTGGKEFEPQTLLVGWIFFAIMFGSTSTVWVESVSDTPHPGADEAFIMKVEGVPTGIAVAGGMISRLGYVLTNWMETAFGTLSGHRVSQGGFGKSIEMLQLPMSLADPRLPAPQMQNYVSSMANYVSDCMGDAMGRGRIAPNDLLMYPNKESTKYASMTEMLAVGRSNWSTTAIYDLSVEQMGEGSASPVEKLMTCDEAYEALKKVDTKTMVNAALSQPGRGAGSDEWGGMTVLQEIEDTMHAVGFVGDSEKAVENLAFAALMTAAIQRSAAKNVMGDNRTMSQLMIAQATQQRATQWLAEATLFGRVLKPMMGFFEGVVFALAPFIAFLTMLGTFGLRKLVTYAVLTIWCQLWLPCLAITNLYMNIQAKHGFNALAGFGKEETISVLDASRLWMESMEWLSTASTIAASTPAFTMFLLFGGAVAATHYARQLQSADHINEKMVSPDLVQPGAVVSQSPQFAADQQRGLRAYGSEQGALTYSFGETSRIDKMSSLTEAAEAGRALTRTLGQTVTTGDGMTDTQRSSWASSVADSLNRHKQEVVTALRGTDLSWSDLWSASVDQKTEASGSSGMQGQVGADAVLGASTRVGTTTNGGGTTRRTTTGSRSNEREGPSSSRAPMDDRGRTVRPTKEDTTYSDTATTTTQPTSNTYGDDGIVVGGRVSAGGSVGGSSRLTDAAGVSAGNQEALNKKVAQAVSSNDQLALVMGRVFSSAAQNMIQKDASFEATVKRSEGLQDQINDTERLTRNYQEQQVTSEAVGAGAQLDEKTAAVKVVGALGGSVFEQKQGVAALRERARALYGDEQLLKAEGDVQRWWSPNKLEPSVDPKEATVMAVMRLAEGIGGAKPLHDSADARSDVRELRGDLAEAATGGSFRSLDVNPQQYRGVASGVETGAAASAVSAGDLKPGMTAQEIEAGAQERRSEIEARTTTGRDEVSDQTNRALGSDPDPAAAVLNGRSAMLKLFDGRRNNVNMNFEMDALTAAERADKIAPDAFSWAQFRNSENVPPEVLRLDRSPVDRLFDMPSADGASRIATAAYDAGIERGNMLFPDNPTAATAFAALAIERAAAKDGNDGLEFWRSALTDEQRRTLDEAKGAYSERQLNMFDSVMSRNVVDSPAISYLNAAPPRKDFFF